MRVIAGSARSLKLITPTGDNTRPTQDRIKETLFNILSPDIPECVFLDMFAGSGGIGIEALSRGASKAFFIDNNKEALNCIETNLKTTHLADRAVVLKGNAISCLGSISAQHIDIVFMDPPYQAGLEAACFETMSKMSNIDEDTLIILEADIKKNFEFPGFDVVRVKEYKTNKHIFMRKNNE